ncbi:Plasmodium exported protein (PHISTb), unknown function [Plasmodium sp. DRC-Itaito]|nr:Plasmodium exported protein (PHISTb), unknown function [Plasmodium sp. DRC-Itaito]
MDMKHFLKKLFLRYSVGIFLGLFYIVLLNICKYDGKARLSNSFMNRCPRSLLGVEQMKEYLDDNMNNDMIYESSVYLMDDPLKHIMYDNYARLSEYVDAQDTYTDDELNELFYEENEDTSKDEHDEIYDLVELVDNLNAENNMKSKMDETEIYDMKKLKESFIDFYNDRKNAASKLVYVGKSLRPLLFENYKDVSTNVDKSLIDEESKGKLNDNIYTEVDEREKNRFDDVIVLKEEEKPLLRGISNKEVKNDLYEENKKYKKESEDIVSLDEYDINELLDDILHLKLHEENDSNRQQILREYMNDTVFDAVQSEVKTIFHDDSFRKDDDDDKFNISYLKENIPEYENIKKLLDDIFSYRKIKDINKLIRFFKKYSRSDYKIIVECANYLLYRLNMEEVDKKSFDSFTEEFLQSHENNIFKKNAKLFKYIQNEEIKKEYELDLNNEKMDIKRNVYSNEKDLSINEDISSLESYNMSVRKFSDLWLNVMKNEREKFNHMITALYRFYRTLIRKYKVPGNLGSNEWNEVYSNIQLHMKNIETYFNTLFNKWINNNKLNIGEFKILVMLNRFSWRKFKKDLYDSNKKYITKPFQAVIDEANTKKKELTEKYKKQFQEKNKKM